MSYIQHREDETKKWFHPVRQFFTFFRGKEYLAESKLEAARDLYKFLDLENNRDSMGADKFNTESKRLLAKLDDDHEQKTLLDGRLESIAEEYVDKGILPERLNKALREKRDERLGKDKVEPKLPTR